MNYKNNKIDPDEVVVDGLVLYTLSLQLLTPFTDHSRTIFNFYKYGNIGITDLDIDITLKNKYGQS